LTIIVNYFYKLNLLFAKEKIYDVDYQYYKFMA